MQAKTIVKVCVDAGMTVMLLLLMAYEMIGQTAHEWLGIGIVVLFVILLSPAALYPSCRLQAGSPSGESSI